MNVLFVSSEVAGFAKTGGLGDVSAALPRALGARGHDVRVVMPMYARVEEKDHGFERVIREGDVELGGVRVVYSVFRATLPGSQVPVYFVRCPSLYGRPSIYGQDGDEHLRFAVLCWAALQICQRLRFSPDVVHANDWQTALLPILLKSGFAWDRMFDRTRTVLTIHNIGHQGSFDAGVLPQTGLGGSAHLVHGDQLREGRFNFLLTGILYANAITTVSPTYAREIQHDEQGVGLAAFLRERREVLFGILNGIDEGEWDPSTDRYLPATYSLADLAGKEACKHNLVTTAGLPYARHVPVFGVVSRLVWQKGFDLCQKVLPRVLAKTGIQLAVLGTGEPEHEQFFSALARRFPKQVAYRRAFSEEVAHLIEAGADVFLMPSRYEPCGLNQMYSLRYGTAPIVHKTGGLADTVSHFDPRTGRGNGFVFEHFDEGGLGWAIGQALAAWGSGRGKDRERWHALQKNGMTASFGWAERVTAYEQVYRLVAPGRG
ncbi:MAG: glycogen synthase [Myxococcales bacterium]|nr:glycogen synthase [Myxococcales bacterium]